MTLLIKNGHIINPATGIDKKMDLLVDNGLIEEMANTIHKDADRVIDAKGMWVVPGLVDAHVHLREPGFEYKETIETGTASASAGGFTTVCAMPNTKPITDNEETVALIMEKSREANRCNVIPVGAMTMGQKGLDLSPMAAMKKAGIGAVSEDGRSVLDAKVMKEAMKLAKTLDLPVLSHCEDEALAQGGCMNEGRKSVELGLQGIPNDAEDLITARDILLAQSTGARLHLCHVSTKGSVALIRRAKKDGLNVTAEVCPHHFTLTDDIINGSNTNAKMNPPLRTQEDLEAMIEGLADGTIDCIATDHAPHSEDEKSGGFPKAANGIVGLETAFGLSKTYLVDNGILSPMGLIEKMSLNPAKMLGVDKGNLSPGKTADLAIINPDEEWTVDKNSFKSKGRNTPFNRWQLKGRVKYTILMGKVVYEEQ